MNLDRHGNVLSCQAEPIDTPPSIDLAHLIQDVCWSHPWSDILEGLQRPEDGGLTVSVPLFVSNKKPLTDRGVAELQKKGRTWFLWNNIFTSHSISTWGHAYFLIVANNEGHVLQCNVELVESPYRPESFHPDQPFQEQLAHQCQKLDLRSMPGFEVSPEGQSRYSISVDYSPPMNNIGHYEGNTAD